MEWKLMDGQGLINATMRCVGKAQVLTTDTVYRATALVWLNLVKNDICSRHPHWSWLEKTVTFDCTADQLSYDIPSDISKSGRKTWSLRQKETPIKLSYVNQRRFDELVANPILTTGNAYYYTISSGSLRLWPMPNASYTLYLRYLLDEADDFTDASTDHAQIPTQYDKVFLDGMLVFAYQFSPAWGNPALQTQIYEAGIGRMIRDDDITLDADHVSSKHDMPGREFPHSFNKDDVGS